MGYRARGGRPFAAFTVQNILTNPAISGKLVYGRKPRKGNPRTELVEVATSSRNPLSRGVGNTSGAAEYQEGIA